jgi:hypothetical protein
VARLNQQVHQVADARHVVERRARRPAARLRGRWCLWRLRVGAEPEYRNGGEQDGRLAYAGEGHGHFLPCNSLGPSF